MTRPMLAFVVAFVVVLASACGGTDRPAAPLEPDVSEIRSPRAREDGGASPRDAAPPGAAPPACGRAEGTRAAPPTLFDDLTTDLTTLTGAARQARVDVFFADVAAHGGTPLEDGDRVVFVARGGGPFRVATSREGFDPALGPVLVPIEGTDAFVADVQVPRGGSFTYKLVEGDTFREDPLAKNVAWDGIDRGTVGEMNAVGHAADGSPTEGRLRFLGDVAAPGLAGAHPVWAYLPPRYDDGTCAPLPVVVFQDGNESLTRGDFAGVADALYASRPELSAVLVFVGLPDQNERLAEYTFGGDARGDAYVTFLAEVLLPRVAAGLRLCPATAARGIAGASLGGLISTYAAFERPTTWGWVGAQSPSYFWGGDALVARAKTSSKIPVRFYLDSGCPQDNCDVTEAMNAALVGKGYDVVRVKEPGARHAWSAWSGRLAVLLTSFREGQSACP